MPVGIKIFCSCIYLTATSCFTYSQPKLVLPIGHTDFVNSITYSPDGKKILTTSSDGTAKIWSAVDGMLLADLKRTENAFFSPDGKKIFTIYKKAITVCNALQGNKILSWETGTLFDIDICFYNSSSNTIITIAKYTDSAKIWNEYSGKLVAEIFLGNHLLPFAYSPDGAKLVSTEDNKNVKLWNTADGKLTGEWKLESEATSTPVSSFDSKTIAIFYNDTIDLRDADNGKLTRQLTGHTKKVIAAKFSPDDRKIISIDDYGNVKMWSMESGKIVWETTGISALTNFSEDGRYIITTHDKTVKLFNAADGKLISELDNNHEQPINFTKCSNDGKFILITDEQHHAVAWDVDRSKILWQADDYWPPAVFSLDGKYIAAVSGFNVAIRESATGKLFTELKGHTFSVNSSAFSPDGKYLATVSGDKSIKIWDLQDGRLIKQLKGHSQEIKTIAYSPDGKFAVSASYDHTAKIWNTENGALVLTLDEEKKLNNDQNERRRDVTWLLSAAYSPDGKYIVTASVDNYAKVWDAITGQLLFELEHAERLKSASFSPDGKFILTLSMYSLNSIVSIWSAETGKFLNEWIWGTSVLKSFQLNPDENNLLITKAQNNIAEVWQLDSSGKLKLSFKLSGHHDDINSALYSADGKFILTSSNDSSVIIWDAENGNIIKQLKGNTSPVLSAAYSPDGKYILTFAEDNIIKKWNAQSGNLIYTFFSVDSTGYLNQIPGGYYQCPPDAAKLLHYVTPQLEVITFEQLDVKYNRPDKVLEAIDCTDTALMRSYRKAYEKRISRMGIDTVAFQAGYSVPQADFTNRNNISYDQKDPLLKLQIHALDSNYKLDRMNVWINEVPVFGQRGISIKKENKNELDTIIEIKLSEGENKIETSVININGTESYRIPLNVNYIPVSKQQAIIHFVGIGIDQFASSKYNLQYSTKDIRDLATALKTKYREDIIIDTLFNEAVTVSNIKKLKHKLLQTNENDKVIISYSGHGLLSKDFDYFLSTYSINFENPEQNGLAYEELENLLDSIPARKKLLLIDACHSGEVDKEELQMINKTADSMHMQKGIKPVAYKKDEKHLGLKNSFELMQKLFVNVSKSTGATVISAAAGTQFALERNDLQNGVFTYSILETMQKYPTIRLSELKKIVGERVEQLTNGLQKPTSRNETIGVDWELW